MKSRNVSANLAAITKISGPSMSSPQTSFTPGITNVLRCPHCKNGLTAGEAEALHCANGHEYPVVRGVPRFVGTERYARSFGLEWNRFPTTQLDSANGTRISEERFGQLTGMLPSEFAGKRVLEAGCGMGRFLELVAEAGAEVWGADMSSAVEPARENTKRFSNCQVVQADLTNLPFGAEFDVIYSFGVLHHTPDPAASLRALVRHLRPGGRLFVWVYGRGVSSGLTSRWIPRPRQVYGVLLKRTPEQWREPVFRVYAHMALAAGALPVVGRVLNKLLPIQDLRAKGPLQDGYERDGGDPEVRERLRFEWALHSVYDYFTAHHLTQQSSQEVLEWARQAGLRNVSLGPVPVTLWAEVSSEVIDA